MKERVERMIKRKDKDCFWDRKREETKKIRVVR